MPRSLVFTATAIALIFSASSPRGQKENVTADFPIKVSGYIKLDAAWDSSRMVPGNYCLWAGSEATADDDRQFNMTANQSRLCFSLNGPGGKGIETSGRVEFDFYGNGPENKAGVMLRHAFLKATWKDKGFELLAGQTWDVISAFYLPTIYYTAGMAVGDYGYRRPQLRTTSRFGLSELDELDLRFAVSRTIGDGLTINPNSPGDTGEDAGFPTLQGRLAWSSKRWFAGRQLEVAVFGHYGQEEYDLDALNNNKDFTSWSAGVELSLPLHEKVIIKGSFFTGENLDTYVGGIGQGVNTTTLREICSTGGFLYTAINLDGPLQFHFGWGVDDPDNGDLVTTGAGRSRNELFFGNCWYSVTESLRVGLELSYWETAYFNARDGTVFRGQVAVQYSF